jgi:indole-3-glycerol phosphate synthase
MTILDTIVAQKRLEIERLPQGPVTAAAIRAVLAARGGVRDFFGALKHPRCGDVGLIAEIKKASPSAGVIRPDFDAVTIAREYEAAGAGCLSVLTDEKFFQGSLDFLRAARAATHLPALRKDFIIDERQILEAAEAGADAILLIVAILSDEQLSHFHALADASGLTSLVEVHDEEELERALRCGARLLGVNNRNLKTFKVDLAVTEQLAARVRASDRASEILLVAESGIFARHDVERLQRAGAGAILVGESLMRAPSLAGKTAELLGVGPAEEVFDVVDEADVCIGRATRSEVHRRGLRHRATHLFVFNGRGELFLQQRSLTKDNWPGVWDSSASGHLDAGETYDACVVREAGEELGLKLTSVPERIGRLDATELTGMEFCQVYRTMHEGPFVLQPSEVRGGGWFSFEAIDEWITARPADFAGGFRAIWAYMKA